MATKKRVFKFSQSFYILTLLFLSNVLYAEEVETTQAKIKCEKNNDIILPISKKRLKV